MSRTTEALVRQIIETDLDVLDPFIEVASSLIDRICTGIQPVNALEVETWLAAHFICIRDPRLASEGLAGITASYQTAVGMGLNGSMYGQQAMLLDDTGRLASWHQQTTAGKPKRSAGVAWLGTE